jgi:peptidoglycan hydrolase-like protein with peptidoglycan-binding domain
MTTISRSPSSSSTLRFGSTGPAVTRLQQQLKKAGFFQGRFGDSFDAGTRSAVQQFQRANGIPASATGTVGPKTQQALARYADGFEQVSTRRDAVQLNPTRARVDGVSAKAQEGLDRINQSRLRNGKDHSCVTTVRANLRNAGFSGLPESTGDDANNPRGMMSQMLQSGKWTSMNVPGSTEQTINSPYGNVKANVLTGEAYAAAVKNGQIPEGAIVFQANRKWNEANDKSRGSDVGIVRNGGIHNYKQFPNMTVYKNVAEVVVLLPNQ